MVRSKVLDSFAAMYQPGAADFDLEASAAAPQGGVGGLVTRVAQWYADVAARLESPR
jgi:hypothetical protein